MLEAIKNFPQQFSYNPIIKNKKKYKFTKKYIVLGMGGSHLAADLIKSNNPSLNIIIHSDYNLPQLSDKELKQYSIIVSSYSGNTAEVVTGLKMAHHKKLNIICIATGGKIINYAQKNNLPYIKLPDTGIQPRSALGFSCRAMLKAMGQLADLKQTANLAKELKAKKYQKPGKAMAKKLKNYIPIIYSSETNISLAYNWKIKFNENTKIPAFCNSFPELNHNEMNGFDITKQTKDLSKNFYFIFLEDKQDHPSISKRMKVLAKLYKQRKFKILQLKLQGKSSWLKIFSNLLLADWTSYYLAKNYQIDPAPVPMVEKFKKMI